MAIELVSLRCYLMSSMMERSTASVPIKVGDGLKVHSF